MRRGAFALLEVLVALVIIGVAFVAVLRGLFMGLRALKEVRITEQSLFLGESLLQDMEIEPPNEGVWKGRFADDEARFGKEFDAFSYEVEVREVEVRYRYKAAGTPRQELEPLYEASIRVIHDDGHGKRAVRYNIRTYLPEFTVHTDQAIQANQIF